MQSARFTSLCSCPLMMVTAATNNCAAGRRYRRLPRQRWTFSVFDVVASWSVRSGDGDSASRAPDIAPVGGANKLLLLVESILEGELVLHPSTRSHPHPHLFLSTTSTTPPPRAPRSQCTLNFHPPPAEHTSAEPEDSVQLLPRQAREMRDA